MSRGCIRNSPSLPLLNSHLVLTLFCYHFGDDLGATSIFDKNCCLDEIYQVSETLWIHGMWNAINYKMNGSSKYRVR